MFQFMDSMWNRKEPFERVAYFLLLGLAMTYIARAKCLLSYQIKFVWLLIMVNICV